MQQLSNCRTRFSLLPDPSKSGQRCRRRDCKPQWDRAVAVAAASGNDNEDLLLARCAGSSKPPQAICRNGSGEVYAPVMTVSGSARARLVLSFGRPCQALQVSCCSAPAAGPDIGAAQRPKRGASSKSTAASRAGICPASALGTKEQGAKTK